MKPECLSAIQQEQFSMNIFKKSLNFSFVERRQVKDANNGNGVFNRNTPFDKTFLLTKKFDAVHQIKPNVKAEKIRIKTFLQKKLWF